MKRHGPVLLAFVLSVTLGVSPNAEQKKYHGPDGKLRVALAKQPFSPNGLSKGPATMAEGGIQKILADLGATDSSRRSAPDRRGRHRVRRVEAAGHGARSLRGHRDEERARRLLHRWTAGDVPVDARAGCRATTIGVDARADQDRHAVARRASRLQHSGDDAQRIARRHAGRSGHRARAAGHAARRQARSAASGSSRRDGRCTARPIRSSSTCSTTR